MIWEKDGEGFYATINEPAGEILFHLTVEEYNERWDRAMWRPSQDQRTATHGLADAIEQAMRAAELATI